MDRSSRDRVIYAFGPFRLDPAKRTLTREGEPVALTPTVFDALVYLVDHHDRVVSRDELLEAVWPRRTVEASNVSQTIFTLRRTLEFGEPLFSTLTGRGYRFAPTVRIEAAAPPQSPTWVVAEPVGRVDSRPAIRFGSITRALGIGALALAVAGGAGVLWWRATRPAPPPIDVVVAEFDNHTGDRIFDGSLAKALEIDLQQSPALSVVTERTVRDTLVLMTRSPDDPLAPPLAEEVCARANAGAVVAGDIAALGSRYFIAVSATNCSGDRTLAAEKTMASGREAVVPAIDNLARSIRLKLGESRESIQRVDAPLLPARTASLAALQAYSEGSRRSARGDPAGAMDLYRHAVDLDPNFAAAYESLANIASDLKQRDLAIASARRAYDLRDTVGERQRFNIVASYEGAVTQDEDAAVQNLRTWTEAYPSDAVAWNNLANEDQRLGLFTEGVADARRTVALAPKVETPYVVLSYSLRPLGRFDEAWAALARPLANGVAGPITHVERLQVAFARHDASAVAAEEAWAASRPDAERMMDIYEAEIAFGQGRIRAGEALWARSDELCKAAGMASFGDPPLARQLVDLGLEDDARRRLNAMPASTDPRDHLFVMAEVGDVPRTEAILGADLAAFPKATLLNGLYAPEARAALALRQGRPTEAIADLAPATRYAQLNFDVPYLMGQAFLAARDGAGAKAQFDTILGHPGQDPLSPLYPLARLGRARALALIGDREASRRDYRTFLDAWKGADPGLPLAQAARTEFSRL